MYVPPLHCWRQVADDRERGGKQKGWLLPLCCLVGGICIHRVMVFLPSSNSAHPHIHTRFFFSLTASHTGVLIILDAGVEDGIRDLVADLVCMCVDVCVSVCLARRSNASKDEESKGGEVRRRIH